MKQKMKKYHTVGIFLKFNRKIVERSKINTSSRQIYDYQYSFTWLGTGTTINNSKVEQVLWAHKLASYYVFYVSITGAGERGLLQKFAAIVTEI